MLRKLIKISGYIFTSVVGGLVMMSIYQQFKKDKEENIKTESSEPPYECLFALGMSKEDVIKTETEENIARGVVEEETPQGKIIMTFDNDTNNYLYYGVKSIPYKHLETVARKYVIIFDCKDKYVNIFRELYNAWELVENKKELDKKKEEEGDDSKSTSVFASLKTYNSGVKEEVGADKSSKAESQKKYAVVNEKANQYSYKGSCEDYFESLKEKKVTTKNISWAEFKANK